LNTPYVESAETKNVVSTKERFLDGRPDDIDFLFQEEPKNINPVRLETSKDSQTKPFLN